MCRLFAAPPKAGQGLVAEAPPAPKELSAKQAKVMLLTFYYSSLTTHHLLLTTYYLLLTTHYSLLAFDRLLSTTYR